MFIGVPSAGFAVASFVRYRKGSEGPLGLKAALLFLMIPVMTLTGVLRYNERNVYSDLDRILVKSSSCSFGGTVESVSVKNDSYTIVLEPETLCIPAFDYEATPEGLLSVTVKNELAGELYPGDYLQGEGKIYPLSEVRNPGQFDEKTYYRTRNIVARVYTKEIHTHFVPESIGIVKSLSKGLYKIKSAVIESIRKSFGDDMAGVLISILTGERGLLDAEIKDAFTTGGIAHILAVSGLHISLVASIMFSLMLRLTRRLRPSCVITFIVVFGYGLFTGFSVSTVRAVIMTGIMLCARFLFRTYDLLSAAAAAALIILMANPMFIHDGGFMMSFTAIAGVGVATEITTVCRIRNKTASTLVTNVFVNVLLYPVLINTYYYVSPYSFVVNLIVIPLMSVLVPVGVLSAVFGMLGLVPVAKLFAGPAYYILKAYEMLCNSEELLPGGKLVTGHRSEVTVMIYFAIVAVAVVLTMTFRKKRILLILLACLFLFMPFEDSGLKVRMFDVGQGDCILLSHSDDNVLIDAGSMDVSNVYKYRIKPALMYYGIDSLDYVVMTHPDKDHKSGIEELLEDGDIEVEELVVSPYADGDEKVIRNALAKGVRVTTVSAGDHLPTDDEGLLLRVISPDTHFGYRNANSSSIVLEAVCGQNSVLFTGDSDSLAEEIYLPQLSRDSYDILKVSHHGSASATSGRLLNAVKPQVGIISCSKTNSYGHPSGETLSRLNDAGCSYYITAQSGMIEILFTDRIEILTLNNE